MKQYRCLITWIEKDKEYTARTRDVDAGMRVAQAVSDAIKDECYCVVQDSNHGDRWNMAEVMVYRSGVRI